MYPAPGLQGFQGKCKQCSRILEIMQKDEVLSNLRQDIDSFSALLNINQFNEQISLLEECMLQTWTKGKIIQDMLLYICITWKRIQVRLMNKCRVVVQKVEPTFARRWSGKVLRWARKQMQAHRIIMKDNSQCSTILHKPKPQLPGLQPDSNENTFLYDTLSGLGYGKEPPSPIQLPAICEFDCFECYISH